MMPIRIEKLRGRNGARSRTELLDEAALALRDAYRVVVMMRDVEEMDTAETAAALNLTAQNVKVRLHRGHAMIRDFFFRAWE